MTSSEKHHLHPAVIQLILAGFSAFIFAMVAWSIETKKPITILDSQQSIRFYDYAQKHGQVREFALLITDLGAGRARTIVIVATALILLGLREWRLALLWAATQWLVQHIVGPAKDLFERPRPEFEDTAKLAGGWSFPSGHATGVMATYGMLAFLIALRWPSRWFTWASIAVLAAIILMVGLSRMLLGVHWFSDVLGGYLLGLTWISLCLALIEWQRWRNPRNREEV